MTQSNFGNALRALGEPESGTERAVAAYSEALTVITREASSFYFEGTQRALAPRRERPLS